jgi:hypothetical protein
MTEWLLIVIVAGHMLTGHLPTEEACEQTKAGFLAEWSRHPDMPRVSIGCVPWTEPKGEPA